jgi:hypothetical protein
MLVLSVSFLGHQEILGSRNALQELSFAWSIWNPFGDRTQIKDYSEALYG